MLKCMHKTCEFPAEVHSNWTVDFHYKEVSLQRSQTHWKTKTNRTEYEHAIDLAVSSGRGGCGGA